MQFFLNWLGFDRHNEFKRGFLYRRNIIGAISMSIVAIGLEIWMCLSLLKYMADHDKMGLGYFLSHGYEYLILMGASIVMLAYGIHYVRQRERAARSVTGGALIGAFAMVCIWFGTYFGLKSYAKSEQTFAYMTMVMFVFCLLVWRPFVGGLFSGGTFLLFAWLCNQTPDLPLPYSFKVNLFTLWIVMFMFILNNYRSAVSQAEKDESLMKQAREDGLTGLLNQSGFEHDVELEINGLREKGGEQLKDFGLLFINIENFKAYNETYGLAEGDQLLVDFADYIRDVFGEYPVGRLHDERFAVMTRMDGIHERAEKLNRFITNVAHARRVHLENKIGAATLEKSIQTTLDNARYACGSLKHKAGSDLQFYDEKFRERVHMRQFVISSIVPAVEAGHIQAYYQPVMDSHTRRVIGYEALARWKDPDRGLIQPFAFIETLEEFRLIPLLDREIVTQVIKHQHKRILAGKNVVPVSVNFSQIDFDIFDVCDFLITTCDQYQVPRNLIDVEITESALSDNSSGKKELMQRIKEAGFQIWLDDFGSGYSSLNVLKEFSFDVIKIDMVFMREYDKYQNTRAIVGSIIELAGKLGVRTLTEGVENTEQADFLEKAGCDILQGFLFSRPEPPEEIEKLVSEGKLQY